MISQSLFYRGRLDKCLRIIAILTGAFGFSLCAAGQEPAVHHGPKGVVRQQVRVSNMKGHHRFDFHETTFELNWAGPHGADSPLPSDPILPDQKDKIRSIPNKCLYPVVLGKGSADQVTAEGGFFRGVQHPGLTWRVMKILYDGCGIHIKADGLMTFRDMHFDNVMDAIRPYGKGRFLIENVYARYIRDDFVENDGLLPGEIRDSLVDGAFMFLSQRPAKGSEGARRTDHDTDVTTITNTLVRIMAMPFDHGATVQKKRISSEGLAPGALFKWSPMAGLVHVDSCIFLVDTLSANGPNNMRFPEGTYRNVTLIWAGEGDYPAPVPEGVTLSRDRSVWERARKSWFEARNLPFLPEPSAFLSK